MLVAPGWLRHQARQMDVDGAAAARPILPSRYSSSWSSWAARASRALARSLAFALGDESFSAP